MVGLGSELKVVRGPSGLGEVRFNKSAAKIIAASGDVYEIANEKIDKHVPRNNLTNIWFSLSGDESQLYSIRPAQGTFLMQFGGLTRRSSEDGGEETIGTYMKMRPAGERKNPQTGKTQKWPERPPEERFTAVLSIVSGDFTEYQYTYWLPYIFAKVQGSQYAKLYTSSPNRKTRVENFLDLTGWDRETMPIPWSEDNGQILEYVETRLLEIADSHRFMGIIRDGYPQSLEKPLEGLVTDAPKRPRKRAVQKTVKPSRRR
mgnify:CR=1 FL=1